MGTFKIHFALVALFGSFALTGCNNTAFTAAPTGATLGQIDPIKNPPAPVPPGIGNTNPTGCTIGKVKKPIRVMFMIDNSGSTITTDPKQYYRVQTLQKFISDYGMNANLTYNFGYFAGTTATAYDMITNNFVSGSAPNATGGSAALSTALLAYENVPIDPNAHTPYAAATGSLNTTIAADEKAGGKQDYAIVFMSDGQPTDISGATALKGLVDTLSKTASGNGSAITFNTIYFGPSNDTASMDNLHTMATEGAGQFVDTNKIGAGGLVINDVINVPGASCN
jgi:hypothetical protein